MNPHAERTGAADDPLGGRARSVRRRNGGPPSRRPSRRAWLRPWPLRTSEPAGQRPGAPSISIETLCARSAGSGVSTARRGGSRKTHSPPSGTSRGVSSDPAVALSRRMARVIASSRTASDRVRIASSLRTGSKSNENGTCGSSISQASERPAVRTLDCNTRRCGPLVGKSPGMIENATSPRPAFQGENSSSAARRAPAIRWDHSRSAPRM